MIKERIKSISSGYHHSIILTITGKIYGVGSNMNGEIDPTIKQKEFYSIQYVMDDIRRVFCGHHSTILEKKDGILLGRGSDITELKIKGSEIKQFYKRDMIYELILTHDGEVYGKGVNRYKHFNIGDKIFGDFGEIDWTLLTTDKSIKYISVNNSDLYIYRDNGNKQITIYLKTTSKDMLMDDEVIGFGDIRFNSGLVWKNNKMDGLEEHCKDQIMMFLFVCRCFNQKYKVNMVKYMKLMIIENLFI